MSQIDYIRANALGDLRAEADHAMLSQAFLETADYRTLIETSDRTIVVGRRGTGKSALALQLEQFHGRESRTVVVKIKPEEHQTIGIRPQIALFGDTFSKIRAGARLAWRFAFMMEAAHALAPTYKFKESTGFQELRPSIQEWLKSGSSTFGRYSETLKHVTKENLTPEERIADLSTTLNLTKVENAFAEACKESTTEVLFIVDSLDEGYEPDRQGAGLIDGLVHAAIDIQTRIPRVRSIIFLRDNIHRAVQYMDPDYSRNLEGNVLRLHWDVESLFSFAARRLQVAFNIPQEASQRVWNKCTAGDLVGRDGFTRCLQHTLYRPRDLLSLLNEAFYGAGKHSQSRIVSKHIESAAQTISRIRLEDLRKEYDAILPGLPAYISAFYRSEPNILVDIAHRLLEELLEAGSDDPVVQQDFHIFDNPQDVLRSLYSIGFIGVRDAAAGTFVFCHDGRAPDRKFSDPDSILIHPCYWIALNCKRDDIDSYQADEIFDEYDIEVSSETPEIRNSKIQDLLDGLLAIPLGNSGATEFESWCHRAIRICFAKGLRNVELKPNKMAKSRRDVVATNLGEGDAWRRIYEDYGTRQVTFEIKNVEELTSSDYQQIQSYLTGDYGRLGFVVSRSESVDLYKNKDVEWIRELYATHKVLIIKLTGKFLGGQLEKLRKPQKHDAVDNSIHSLLDTYARLYVAGQTKKDGLTKARRRKRRSRRRP